MWTWLVAPEPLSGVADNPAHGVAGGDRAGADELLARLERDVGDLADRGVDLIERAACVGIDLHGVDEAVADRLHARGGVGLVDAHRGVGRLRCAGGMVRPAAICPGSGSGRGSSTTRTGAGGSALSAAGTALS